MYSKVLRCKDNEGGVENQENYEEAPPSSGLWILEKAINLNCLSASHWPWTIYFIQLSCISSPLLNGYNNHISMGILQ